MASTENVESRSANERKKEEEGNHWMWNQKSDSSEHKLKCGATKWKYQNSTEFPNESQGNDGVCWKLEGGARRIEKNYDYFFTVFVSAIPAK